MTKFRITDTKSLISDPDMVRALHGAILVVENSDVTKQNLIKNSISKKYAISKIGY